MPPTHTQKNAPTRESVWFVVLLPSGFYEDDWYFYDESGSPYGFNFTNSNNESGIRYFVRNLQGDIIESGSSTSFGASHKYDAWGAVTETVLGSSTNAANFQYGYIFGYRGYQYDKETGLYYCQSRYYNPRVGRFVSADDSWIPQMSVGDLFTPNLYLYADNNPVNMMDSNGYVSEYILVAKKNITFGQKITSVFGSTIYLPFPGHITKIGVKMCNLAPCVGCYSYDSIYSKITKKTQYLFRNKLYNNKLSLYMAFISDAKVKNHTELRKMDEINIVARAIYGESKNANTQTAVALSIYYRYKYTGKKDYFYNKTYGHNYKGVVMFRTDYLCLWDTNNKSIISIPTGKAWENAKKLAAKLILGEKIGHPNGYTNQKFFVGLSYWKSFGKITNSSAKSGTINGNAISNIVQIGDHWFFNYNNP